LSSAEEIAKMKIRLFAPAQPAMQQKTARRPARRSYWSSDHLFFSDHLITFSSSLITCTSSLITCTSSLIT